MDCGIPFCHQGCPLGNLIPDWNDLVYRDRWQAAIERLHATNNFPEFTGRLCPAPCEGSCVLGINDDPVTIKSDRAVDRRARVRRRAGSSPRAAGARARGKRVAVVGSGPAGLAAADQLNRAGHLGHRVRARRSDRRPAPLRHSRVQDGEAPPRPAPRADGAGRRRVPHRASTSASTCRSRELRARLRRDRARRRRRPQPRDLPMPGRELTGIHFAMDYLTQQNRRCEGDAIADDEFITRRRASTS